MPVTIRCPNPACGKSSVLSDEQARQPFRCPGCAKSIALRRAVGDAKSATASTVCPTPTATRIGRFEIRDRLGAGAFGTVYRAYDPQLAREVALKVPNAGVLDSPKRVERFLREAKAAAGLRHPSIVPVFDAGIDGTQHYIATAFVKGRPLAEAVEDGGIELRRAVGYARQLAEALAYAHEQGVVHRDVKPANVLIDDRDRVHLLDFGLAARSDEESRLTSDGAVMGTPAYMSPEQAAGQMGEAKPHTDQYAAGVVLYELLTGRVPFEGPLAVVIHNVIHTPAEPPSKFRAGLPQDLETVCLKAMAKRPEDRYADCQELADDLRRWTEGEPIAARRLTRREQFARWVRKNPAVAGLSAAVAALLIVGMVTASVLALAATASATRATAEAKRADGEREEADRQRQLAVASATDARRHQAEAESTASRLLAERARVRQQEYVADLRLAQNAWNEGRLSRTRELLARHEPRAGEPDIRGFEWHYLSRLPTLANSALKVRGSSGKPAVSPDGAVTVVPHKTGGVSVCLAGSAEPVVRGTGGPPAAVVAVTAHPTEARFAGVTDSGRVLVWEGWDATSPPREVLQRPVTKIHPRVLHSVAYNRAGDRMAVLISSGETAELVVIDPATGGVIYTSPKLPPAWGLDFHPTEPEVVVAYNGGVQILDYGRRRLRLEIPLTTQHHALHGDYRNPVFTRDGRFVVAGTYQGQLVVWSADDGARRRVIDAHYSETNMIVMAGEANRLVSSSFDGTFRVWDCDTWVGSAPFRGHAGAIDWLACARNATTAVTVSDAHAVHRWDLQANQIGQSFAAAGDQVEAVALPPEGDRVLGATYDGVAGWDLGSGRREQLVAATGQVCGFAASRDGKALYVGTPKGIIATDAGGDQRREIPVPVGQAWNISGVGVSPDGTLLAVRHPDGPVVILRAGDGTEVRRVGKRGRTVTEVVFSPDGGELLVSYRTEGFTTWDVKTWAEKRSASCPLLRGVYSVDGQLIATPGWNGDLRVFRASTGEQVHALTGHTSHVLTAAFSPDGRRLISGGMDGAVIIWNLETGQEVLTLRTGEGDVTALAFTPDGKKLLVFHRRGGGKALDISPFRKEDGQR